MGSQRHMITELVQLHTLQRDFKGDIQELGAIIGFMSEN